MIYSLSSLYPSVNLIKRSCATSEPATMTSSKSISSMSKSISESASMTRSSSITSKFMSLFLYRNLNSESATMMNNDWSFDWVDQRTKQALLCSRPESAVSLLQWHQPIVDLFAELVDLLLVSLLQWHQSIVDLFAEQVNFFLHS